MRYLGWAANLLLVAGAVLVGDKSSAGFLLVAAGEALWGFKTWRMRQWDMLFICLVFGLLAVRNFTLWTQGP